MTTTIESIALRLRRSLTLFPLAGTHFATHGHKLRWLMEGQGGPDRKDQQPTLEALGTPAPRPEEETLAEQEARIAADGIVAEALEQYTFLGPLKV